MIVDPAVAAVALRVSVATIYRWINRGAPVVRRNGRVLVNVDQLQAWRVGKSVLPRRIRLAKQANREGK